MKHSLNMTVRRGKAYLPTVYWNEKYGLYLPREPVMVVDLTPESLKTAVEQSIKRGNPSIDLSPEPDETKIFIREARRPAPELKAAGVKSWKQFGQQARAYAIIWTEEVVYVQMSRPFEKGGFTYDTAGTHKLPPDTPLETIVGMIMDHIRSIPELLEEAGRS